MQVVLEVIHPEASVSQAKVCIFDFDGTLSLLRSGWMDVMVPLCVEQLSVLRTGESEDELQRVVEEFVWRLTGKETIYQMMALAEAVQARGGQPLEPHAYKRMYLERLWTKIRHRIEALRDGSASPEKSVVPGARQFLDNLVSRNLRLYLASGTDHENVVEEANLLGLASYFEDRIFGAQDDLKTFSKALLVQRIISTGGVRGDELLVFGDGFVEIEEVKKVGGRAVGLATAEPECLAIDFWKRQRLILAGADWIAPNFMHIDQLWKNQYSNLSYSAAAIQSR